MLTFFLKIIFGSLHFHRWEGSDETKTFHDQARFGEPARTYEMQKISCKGCNKIKYKPMY